ncbi:hypothetical protein PCANC_21574 [Puccinia coronata f. sp. avenae]|uniref:Uncharacterized protein n=1 Tax=Puccinia coronata f. sp. avenae TaxID=200324 RepID=A0A2N5U8X8_9BASI|nr:hypothetical protein PCANC_21574 [Puccinia coronata f. sp. avenae]
MTHSCSRHPFNQTADSYEAHIQHLEDVVNLLLVTQEAVLFPLAPLAPLTGLFRYSMDQGLVLVLSKKTAWLLATILQHLSLEEATPQITPSSCCTPSHTRSRCMPVVPPASLLPEATSHLPCPVSFSTFPTTSVHLRSSAVHLAPILPWPLQSNSSTSLPPSSSLTSATSSLPNDPQLASLPPLASSPLSALSPILPLDSPTSPTAADPAFSLFSPLDPPTTCTAQTPITTAAVLPATAPDRSADRIDVSNLINTSTALASNSLASLPPSLPTVHCPPPSLHDELPSDLAPDLSQAALQHYEDIDNFLKLSGVNGNGKKKKTPDPPSLPDNPVLFYV